MRRSILLGGTIFFLTLSVLCAFANKTPDNKTPLKQIFDRLKYPDYRSTNFEQKLAFYMDSVISQQPDTVFKTSCMLIDRCTSDTLLHRHMLEFLFNRAVESEVPWMENVWVKLADRYYLKQPSEYEDPGWLERLKYNVKLKKNCLIGERASLFSALTPEGAKIDIRELSGRYLIICFYDPDCTHCKQVIPHLHTLYHKYGSRDLNIVAFNISDDIGLWRAFIQKHQLQDWANVWDPDRELSKYESLYEVSLSPSFYILDQERRIIIKEGEIEDIEIFLKKTLSPTH